MMVEYGSGEDCFICGEEMVVRTSAQQECPAKNDHPGPCGDDCTGPWFFDGDPVNCPSCGAMGWITVDAGVAQVSWDELDDHNIECADKYVAGLK